MRVELFLARRYLRPKRNEVSIITLISVVGVMLGVAVLIVVLSVMTGFTNEMENKLITTQQHMTIEPRYNGLLYNPNHEIAMIESLGCKAARLITQPVLIQSYDNFEPRVVLGVNAEEFRDRMNFKDVLLKGSFDLNYGEVVISDYMANRYGKRVGDKITIHSSSQLADMVNVSDTGALSVKTLDEVTLPHEYTVAGIFHFGKYDFDANFLFMGLNDAAELFEYPWNSANKLAVWVPDPMRVEDNAQAIRDMFKNYYVSTWKDDNKMLLTALNTEKQMMFFLLIFIVLVAAFSISNNLITSVYQKTKEIGLLKALGASNGQMMRIFLLQGMLVGCIGTGCGTLLGILVIHYRMGIMNIIAKITGNDVFPKELYFFDKLPAQIVISDLMLIVGISLLLCTLGGLIPAWRAAKLSPAQAFRNE